MCKAFLYALCLENIYKCNIRSFFSYIQQCRYVYLYVYSIVYNSSHEFTVMCRYIDIVDISTVLEAKYRMFDISKFRYIDCFGFQISIDIFLANVRYIDTKSQISTDIESAIWQKLPYIECKCALCGHNYNGTFMYKLVLAPIAVRTANLAPLLLSE